MKQLQLPSKKLLLKVIIVTLFPLNLFAQNLTGLWTGKIYTTEKTLPYEVAITEKDGKLSGYSYTTFNVKGEEMVAMKSVVVTKDKDDNIIIEDIDLVFNSFDEENPKQLKQTNTLQLEIVNDKTMLLIGKFKTFKTDKFRSMTGGIRLRKDSIIEQPKLVAKLEEMDLTKSLSFLPAKTLPETIAVAKVEKPTPVETEVPAPVTAKTAPPPAKTNAKAITTTAAAKPPVASNAPAKPAAKPTAPPKPAAAAAVATTAAKTEVRKTPSRPLSAFMGDRAIENIQTVVFKSDSLILTLYDNGEVDGDTVSILLNGKMIVSKQGLSTRAFTKTIYMTPDMGDSSQLIMYAESLGTIPPNTGLLIIKDGRDRYEIRFAGDLKKNAAIILKRKELN